jgi:leucine-zipper of insertion element IS481
MHHGSARLTIHGRRAICWRVLEEGWTVTKAAWAAGAGALTSERRFQRRP